MPDFTSLFDLALDVISKFKPSRVQFSIRRVRPKPTDKLPEAQYQDEFYRSLFCVTFGNARVSPEFASARKARVAGRIDFFIPAVKWGSRLLENRDGSRLNECSSRFAKSGVYGAPWLTSGDMADYTSFLTAARAFQGRNVQIQNLFHAVFQDGYQNVVVYNNMAEQVKAQIVLP